MSEAPGTYRRFKAERPDIAQAYERLSALTVSDGPLTEREVRLVRLGIALGSRSPGAVKSAARKAHDVGVTREELDHAAILSLVNIGLSEALGAVGDIRGLFVPVEAASRGT